MKSMRIILPVFGALTIIAWPGMVHAQEDLIPPGSVQSQPAVEPVAPPTRPAPQPAALPPGASAAELQALFARNAAIIASQQQMLEQLEGLAEQARTIRVRAARN